MELKKLFSIVILIITSMFLAASAFSEDDAYKASALSWQKQANDTRATVVSVYEELTKIGDQGNADAKQLIEDAVNWLGEGDKDLKSGDEKLAEDKYDEASYSYNMSWQYYVKAATAGLNARRILTGQ